MRFKLFAAAGALTVATIAPAVAQQVAPQPQQRPVMKDMSRAQLVQTIQQRFARIDQNRDGFITQAELKSLRAANKDRRQQKLAANKGKRFDRLDVNNDGAISRAEFDSAHQARAGQGDKMGRHMRGGMHMAALGGRMFQMADANRDGRVSLQEATSAAVTHFDAADANRDGVLTRDERRSAFQRMGGRARG